MAEKKKNKIKCNDKKCPFHGKVRLRGRTLKGIVIAVDAYRSATIRIKRIVYVRKYERYEKRKKMLRVHNPECINAKDGDIVIIKECRPLSKTKHFVIIKKEGSDYLFKEKEEALEESKIQKEPKKEESAQEEKEDAGSESKSD